MKNPSDDTYSEPETAARAETTLKRMLATKPTPHKPNEKPKPNKG